MQITLRAARINANLTQSEVAAALGVTSRTVAKHEAGITQPTIMQVIKLLQLYSCRFEDLIFLPNETAESGK